MPSAQYRDSHWRFGDARAFLGALLVLSSLVFAKAQDKPSTVTAPVRTFSVATYNVYFRNTNLAALVTTIRQADADLIALQETNAESEKYLRHHLRNDYRHFLFRSGKGNSDGFGFISRAPLGTPEFLGVDSSGRGGWSVETRVGTVALRVISVHLTTPRIVGVSSLTELIKAFAACEQIHRHEVAVILPKVRPEMPTIILGDFNSFSFGVGVTGFLEHGMIDSFASVTPESEKFGTWIPSSKIAGSRQPVRIDYILHDRSFVTRASQVLRGSASDHALVVSTLELKGNK